MRRRGAIALVVLGVVVLPAQAGAATLGGTVWTDRDSDGLRERGETPVRGVVVEVQRAKGRRFVKVATRTTGRAGTWSMTVRRAGRYRARLTLPPATRLAPRDKDRRDRLDSDVRLVAKKAQTPVRRLTRRSRAARFDMGLVPQRIAPPPTAPAAPPVQILAAPPLPPAPPPPGPQVGDLVWNDLDDDGRQDPGEPGLAGVTVQTWNTARTALLASTTTDAAGRWAIPTTGQVRARVVLPPGAAHADLNVGPEATDSDARATGSSQGFTDPVAGAAGRADIDIGLTFPGTVSIGNRIWDDENENGLQDGGEIDTDGIGGRPVELWNESLTQLLASTSSAGDGGWALQVPRGLSHRVRIRTYATLLPTVRDAGPDDDDSDFAEESESVLVSEPRTVVTSSTTLDLGLVQAFVLGNRAWRDLDIDGRQDMSEPGMPGVTVMAYNGAATAVLRTATTDADGLYRFILRTSGTYRIRFVRPTGFTWTLRDAAADEQLDSDAATEGEPFAGYTELFDPTPNVISTNQFDAGFITD